MITSPRTGHVLYRYVGKAKDGAGRSLSGYERNVRKVLADHPYRKGTPAVFGKFRRHLADAARLGEKIALTFFCNVSPDLAHDAGTRYLGV